MKGPEDCAREVLDVIPAIMLTIRAEMRRQRKMGLSVPEFRALGYLLMHPMASLSDVAEHVGTPLPSMSKMIDGLVNQKLVHRETSPDDRRKIKLALTPAGKTILQSARRTAQVNLSKYLYGLSPQDCATVMSAMSVLKKVFPATPMLSDLEKETPEPVPEVAK
jgi:DNA-binding MarR family transcriptional regulator